MIKRLGSARWELVALIFILAFGLFIRIYDLGTPVFWIDEATSANVAGAIAETGNPVLDSGLFYGSAFFLHHIMALFLLIGKSEFFLRFPSLIFGLLTIFLAYRIGREYSKSGGLISALFFSVFYLEVFFSRQARYYQLFQLAFFAALYFLYKSKENPKWLYPALIAFFIAYDTHLEGLVLSVFFIAHIIYYNRNKWYLSILPAIPLVWKFFVAIGLSSGSALGTINYASQYLSYAGNMMYLLILFVPGLIWAFRKKKVFTSLIILPSLLVLIGVFSLQTFALRYVYVFVFPLLLYSALLFSFLYDKYGKLMIFPIILLVIIPSNLFFPQTYVNIIKPVSYNFNDASAPYTDYKAVPLDVISELKSDTLLVSYYSPDVEWYVRKPDYVLPFSLTGAGSDEVSFNNSEGEVVDRYSGAPILTALPERPYNLIADAFSVSKLKPNQRAFLGNLTENCSVSYSASDLRIYACI